MNPLLHATGFFAAHAVWCVSDGEILCPFVGLSGPNAQRSVERFEHDEYPQAVEIARRFIRALPGDNSYAVLGYDGYITLEGKRMDAIVVEAYSCEVRDSAVIRISVPYRSAASSEGFAVHRPKFHITAEQQEALPAFAEAFFSGVASHDKASRVWDEHSDESR